MSRVIRKWAEKTPDGRVCITEECADPEPLAVQPVHVTVEHVHRHIHEDDRPPRYQPPIRKSVPVEWVTFTKRGRKHRRPLVRRSKR